MKRSPGPKGLAARYNSGMKFEGTGTYVADEDLKLAVNAAITLERPLLIKGEPGTGKTMLAEEVARALGRPLFQWHIKSTTKAQQGLYEYDAVSRLRDSQLGDERVGDIANYIVKGVLWQAFESPGKAVVLLIDEIDKADIEFPNDLLRELDRMEFFVYETQQTVRAREHRPIVFITSNNEKELPDAFLRRCFFHYIRFPDKETMQAIVDVHFPDIKKRLLQSALEVFFEHPRGAGAEEEALDLGAARLAEAAARRGHPARGAARARATRRRYRRCTARCSRTSRTCTCSSDSSSCSAGGASDGAARCSSISSSRCARRACRPA